VAKPDAVRRRSSAVQSGAVIALVLVAAWGLALAGSDGGRAIGGVPAFALAGAIAIIVQWLVFVPSFLHQTEHYFDLTGSLTYIALALLGLAVGGDGRSLLLALLVLLWAVRLGTFLFRRVRSAGRDRRFDRIKPDFWQFLMTWTLQGLWVFVTLAPALAAMTANRHLPLDGFAAAGLAVWITGFMLEIVADEQKRRFRSHPDNAGRFIETGLWSWSQHPNYFGEIVLWCGVAIISLPVLSGWQWLTLGSPLFVYVLLTRISGVRMLDAQAERRWGDDPQYLAYRRRTSTLVPRPPRPGYRREGA